MGRHNLKFFKIRNVKNIVLNGEETHDLIAFSRRLSKNIEDKENCNMENLEIFKNLKNSLKSSEKEKVLQKFF